MSKIRNIIKQTIRESYGEESVFDIRETTKEDLLPHAEKIPYMGVSIKVDAIPPSNQLETLVLDKGEWEKWKNRFLKRYGDGKLVFKPYAGGSFKVKGNSKYEQEREEFGKFMSGYYDDLKYKGD